MFAFFLENGFFWYVCLLMIVSIDTIECGRQTVLFLIGKETAAVSSTDM